MKNRRITIASLFLVAAAAVVSLILVRTNSERVRSVSPVPEEMKRSGTYSSAEAGAESTEDSSPEDAGGEDAAVVVIDEARWIQGDVLKPMSVLYDELLQYITVPAISADGKSAFIVENTRTAFSGLGITAMLLDVDSNVVIWQKVILTPDECKALAPGCLQLVNDRQREVNAHLARFSTLGWIKPAHCKLQMPEIVHESQDCLPVDFPQACAVPGLTMTFRTPRFHAVTADGSVIVDKDFPPWAEPDIPSCLPDNRPYPKEWGFDLKRRVMFIMLEYCEEGCGHPPQRLHLFRLPAGGRSASSPDGGG